MAGLLADDPTADDEVMDLFTEGPEGTEEDDEDQALDLITEGDDEAPEEDAEEDAEPSEDDEDAAEDEDEDADDEPAERMHTVKVGGREFQVPESELIRGYAGQAYIQQGLQQNAAYRREVEAVYTALQSEREQFVKFVEPLIRGEVPLARPVPPAPEMAITDPIGYIGAKAKYDADVQSWVNTQQELQTQMDRQAKIDEQMAEAHAREQLQKLLTLMPEFRDPKKGGELRSKILKAGTEYYKYDPQELAGVTDPRAIQVLADAARWRDYLASKEAVKQKTKQQPQANERKFRPVLKPGAVAGKAAAKGKAVTKVRDNMRRTGSVDDVAKFLIT
jgi:hypothetical protein